MDLFRRLVDTISRRMYGRALAPANVLAYHRPLLAGYLAVGLAAERFSHSVREPLKQLAMLRTAQLIGCEWCLDFGSWLAQQGQCREQQLRELSTWRGSEQFDELERLVLEYAEAMTRTPSEVSDDLFTRLREHFDERQLVELTLAIGLENLYSRSNWALGIERQGFSEGMYCVAPDPAPSTALVGESAAR